MDHYLKQQQKNKHPTSSIISNNKSVPISNYQRSEQQTQKTYKSIVITMDSRCCLIMNLSLTEMVQESQNKSGNTTSNISFNTDSTTNK